MENENVFRSGANVIYLASCALNGKTPSKLNIDRMMLEDVYRQSARHSMQAMCCNAISSYVSNFGADGFDRELLLKWERDRVGSIRKAVAFDIERERIKAFFESNGIWYVELKGLIFQNYYPKLGMRQMCDNDILFDPAYREKLRDFMQSNGYTVYLYGSQYPDTYMKGELSFEMHHALYTETNEDRAFNDYYSDVLSKLIRRDPSSYEYYFKDEDFYVYCVSHSYKHFSRCGNGIRSLADVYVYLRQKEATLDFDYIDAELEKLGLLEFAKTERVLSKRLFSDCVHPCDMALDPDEVELVTYYTDSGTYGNRNCACINRLKSLSNGKGKVSFFDKFRYVMGRIFPNMDYYKLNYPRAYKYKFPIVFVWFMRVFRLIFKKRKSLAGEIKTISKTK